MKIRTLVVDDEPRARSRMRRLLEPHDDVTVVGEATNGDEAVQKVLELRPDLVFLDIRMPGTEGTAVAARLRDYLPESVRPLVVFTTAHGEHAVEAFGLESLDFLLKPVERDRLSECLRRVRRAVWASGRTAAPPVERAPAPATLTGHHGASIAAIPVNAILVVQVEDGLAFAYTTDGERHRLGEGLAEVEAQLPAPPFARVSRAAVVNIERVDRLVPRESGTWAAVLEDGRNVAISRRRAKHVRDLMGL
ncbi:MAG: LytTR family DNA-binding domain-containing protein [Myxococcota bacterium]